MFLMQQKFENCKKINRVYTLLTKTSEKDSSSQYTPCVLWFMYHLLFFVFLLLCMFLCNWFAI